MTNIVSVVYKALVTLFKAVLSHPLRLSIGLVAIMLYLATWNVPSNTYHSKEWVILKLTLLFHYLFIGQAIYVGVATFDTHFYDDYPVKKTPNC